jgi:CoA-transferase family III
MYAEIAPGGLDAPPVDFIGQELVASAFAATDFAAAAVGLGAISIADLLDAGGFQRPAITVDRTLASAWFAYSLRPQGWTLPPTWDPLAGDYETSDGWVRLHTNAPHHRDAALRVLGCAPEPADVVHAVRKRSALDVESSVVEVGGCAAAMRSVAHWRSHPQGQALSSEPLAWVTRTEGVAERGWVPDPTRPLRGVRVLDLTRVLAGPVSTRFLAGYGASVLRIDPPGWDEAVACEVTLGKRCARVDARLQAGREVLRQLLAQADVFVHGYRPGALEALGLGEAERDAIRPGLIDVSLDAYGWSGPWKGRRGFDSLVQMSTGIADRGRTWSGGEKPHPLPFQALDQATGYFMAALVVMGLKTRMTTGQGTRARCSLARTAHFLIEQGGDPVDGRPAELGGARISDEIEETSWGPAKRLVPPAVIHGVPMRWDLPAVKLGSHPPSW